MARDRRSTRFRLGILTCALCLVAAGAGSVHADGDQIDPYRILISNDDGVRSAGISVLAKELAKMGEVYVVAPLENRSGASHSIEALRGRTRSYEIHRGAEFFGHGVDGTPVDAVIVGLQGIYSSLDFDLIVSGINNGTNVGLASHYSGTVGVAMEGLVRGLPAIAVSQAYGRDDGYALAARVTRLVVEKVRQNGLPEGVLLSINVPEGEVKGVVARPMGGFAHVLGEMSHKLDSNEVQYHQIALIPMTQFQEGTDSHAFSNGYVTITPLKLDWTAYEAIDTVESWKIPVD